MVRRLLVLVLCLGIGPVSAFRAAPEGGSDWPEPSQDTLDYLATIDIRTGQPFDPDADPPSERHDLFGDNLPQGAVVRLCYPWSAMHLVVAPDGRWVVTASHACSTGQVEVFDAATGAKVRRLGEMRGIVSAIAISPDGKTLAVARCGRTEWRDLAGSITLWDLETGEELIQFAEGTGPRALAFAPDGTLASAGGDGLIWLWDTESGEPVWPLADQQKLVHALAFSADGKVVAAASADDRVCLYEFATGKLLRDLPRAARSVSFAPDGKHLAVGTEVVELATGNVRRFDESVGRVAFSPDGRTLAGITASGIKLWELATGMERCVVHAFDKPKEMPPERRLAAFTPDGRRLVTVETDDHGYVWDVTGLDRPGGPPRLTQLQAETLVEELALAGPVKAHGIVWQLALAPEQALPCLDRRLREPPPEPDPRRITQRIAELDDNEFPVRQRASRDLERLGQPAAEALQEVLAGKPSLEVRLRAERILDSIQARHGRTPQQLLLLRAAEVLEHIGTPAARQILAELATSAARESVHRLDRRMRKEE